MSRTGPKNPHRSGLLREPGRFQGSEAERRTGGRGYKDVEMLHAPEFCWCGVKLSTHPGGCHWGALPDSLLDVALDALGRAS